MPGGWWQDEGAIRRRAERVVRAALRQHNPAWLAFLTRRWERKWADFWPDYCDDFLGAMTEAEAEEVFRQLVDRIIAWVADYFLVDEPGSVLAERGARPIRRDGMPALTRRQAQLERARWVLCQDERVRAARALLGDRLLASHEALRVLSSPLLARWSEFTWQRSRIPVIHDADVVLNSTKIEVYWNAQVEALCRSGIPEAEAKAFVQALRSREDVVAVAWGEGERLVSVPREPDIEPTLLEREPLWLMIETPSQLPPPWRPQPSLRDQPVLVPITLPIAHRGSPLARIYQAAERVRQVLGYPLPEAVRWLLMGESTEEEVLGWGSVRLGTPSVGPAWIQLTLLAGLPTEVVIAAYRREVERVSHQLNPALTSTRPLDERTAALARFWHEQVERMGQSVSYEALRRTWNERYPAWRYQHAASFWRAIRNSVREVYGIALPRERRALLTR